MRNLTKIQNSRSLAESFAAISGKKRKALMPFLTAGYPDPNSFVELVRRFAENGADIIEIGIPFSDPMADGKTIQFSSEIALKRKINIKKTFDMLDRLSEKINIPLVIMSYFNPIRSYGLSKFAADASSVGVKGLIIPDMIPDEKHNVKAITDNKQIDLIYLIAPTSSIARQMMIVNQSQGFVYLVTVAGVTGARASLPPQLITWIKKIKAQSPIPVCAGFGISDSVQAKKLARHSDGVIIGSAIIDVMRRENSRGKKIKAAVKFLKQIRTGLDND